MVDKKPWYASKLIWLNILFGIVAVIEAVKDLPFLPPETMQILTVALTVANVILRLFTHQPVTDKGVDMARSVRMEKSRGDF
jgi:hypothetical protein